MRKEYRWMGQLPRAGIPYTPRVFASAP
jgi:hypothetical protein